jgi:hypothetical protein
VTPMRCKAASAAILLLNIAPTIVAAQPDKVAYELQERCGKRAAEIFAHDYPSQPPNGIANYENHYNSRLNKCFMLETSTQPVTADGKREVVKIDILADVNENKVYAEFDPISCDVNGRTCHSEEEWKMLIKPFMEE